MVQGFGQDWTAPDAGANVVPEVPAIPNAGWPHKHVSSQPVATLDPLLRGFARRLVVL